MKPIIIHELLFPRLLRKFRAYKIKKYKSDKIKQEKTPFDRDYLLKFRVKINDQNNPQVSNQDLEILIPAKAVYFAKKIALRHIQENVELIFDSVEEIQD